MTVKEMIECLNKMPGTLTVVTHPAGMSRWMESDSPRVITLAEDGSQLTTNVGRLVVSIV